MKFKYLLAFIAAGLLLACNNELDVNSDWKDITVIYGILDQSADTNYVRVQRGYLGKEPARNSYDQPDSIYYSNITVILNWYEINNGQRGNLVSSAELIEDNTISLNDNGPFTTESYRLYRVPGNVPIVTDYEYEIRVNKGDGSEDAYASTRIIEDFDIKIPNPSANPPKFTGSLKWDNEADNIQIYQPYYYFYYKDYDLTTKEFESHVVEYKYSDVPKKTGGSDYVLAFSPVDIFFNYIADKIPDDPNKLRFFEKIEFDIWGTDEILNTYMNLQTPAQGINQNRPDYTNVTNGVGIFSSRIKIEVNNSILNESGTPSFKDFLQVKEVMCSKRFASVTASGDTCVCNVNSTDLSLKCPYDQ